MEMALSVALAEADGLRGSQPPVPCPLTLYPVPCPPAPWPPAPCPFILEVTAPPPEAAALAAALGVPRGVRLAERLGGWAMGWRPASVLAWVADELEAR